MLSLSVKKPLSIGNLDIPPLWLRLPDGCRRSAQARTGAIKAARLFSVTSVSSVVKIFKTSITENREDTA